MAAKDRACARCPHKIYRDNKTGLCRDCLNLSLTTATPETQVETDRERQQHKSTISVLRQKYEEALRTIERQTRELHIVGELHDRVETHLIEPREPSNTGEGTVVWVGSDWHIEENVGPEVGGLNTFNTEIAQQRATRFFQAGLRLTNLLRQDIHVHTIVLALLGDFISNDIHEEFSDLTELQPVHAIVTAQNMLISGIEFILANSEYELTIIGHSGNHARTTKTTRFGAENGHSLEYLMYQHLQAYFRNEPRVTFLVPAGYHSYVNIYGQVVRFHHGHAIRYQGGVGGIYIPTNKAIAQWNKARHADLDVFGHFHQLRDGGNFISNGSLIGYNAFALSIKADYEAPKQALFMMDRKRGRTCTWPLLLQ